MATYFRRFRTVPRGLALALALAVLTSSHVVPGQEPERREEELRRRAPQRERVLPPAKESGAADRDRERPTDRDQLRTGADRDVRDQRSTRDSSGAEQGRGSKGSPDPAILPGAGIPVAPPPLPPSSGWPVYGFEEEITLDCPEVWICPLDPADDYLAWKLVWQTSIPYRHFAELRGSGLSWAEVFEELDVEFWEPYYALGVTELPDSLMVPTDAALESLVLEVTSSIRLPRFPCDDPVVLDEWSTGGGLRRHVNDLLDEDIAQRISEETGWCVGSLMKSRELLGSWSRVTRRLSISPLIFEASFGIELQLEWADGRRHIRYPHEEAIRYVAESQLWPELSASY